VKVDLWMDFFILKNYMRTHQIVHPIASKMNNNFDKTLDQEHFGDLLFLSRAFVVMRMLER
jgi:hypothetical protein